MTVDAMVRRMKFPARDCSETDRVRAGRLALTASAERQHGHAQRFDRGREFEGFRSAGSIGATAAGLTLDEAAWRRADFGGLCKLLGLRPSRPHEAAPRRRVAA